jgi:two-component sensor histidine kinase
MEWADAHPPCPGPPAHTSISVRDTGVGFPEGIEFRHTHSLGLQSVYLLTEQLGGTITLERTA